MKLSLRINGRVTSIQLRDSVAALHYLLSDVSVDINHHISNKAYEFMRKWPNENARGLSGHITDLLLQELVHLDEQKEYTNILKSLEV